jgi:hypothetical protein
MANSLTKAKYYRDEAEHLRKQAAEEEDTQTREALLIIAKSCDRLYAKHAGVVLGRV